MRQCSGPRAEKSTLDSPNGGCYPFGVVADFVLALDQGTSSSRAILFDHAGTPVASAQQPFEQIYPQPGWVEHDPETIWESQL